MFFGKRPNAFLRFGATNKPGSLQKQVKRDENGELQLAVTADAVGHIRVDFGRPVTHISLPSGKAYDFAHLLLEHTKDKQEGVPVNVTEEKILDGLSRALSRSGVSDDAAAARRLATAMLPEFVFGLVGESEVRPLEGVKS